MSTPVIDINKFNRYFGHQHVVRDLSLQVKKGEIFGFLGPNGSGKTTSIRMMCGLLSPSSGQGSCLGLDIIKQKEEIRRHVGYMTQYFSLWSTLSIRENLAFIARIYQLKQPTAAIDNALALLNLTDRQHQLARSLSGGWKQRLALAGCLIHQPKVIFLDEPTAGVDPTARQELWQVLYRLSAEGVTILVSTHYMDEAERCNTLAYISNGDLLIKGSPAEIIGSQNLSAWEIQGENLTELENTLSIQPSVAHVIRRGNTLYATSNQRASLDMTQQPHGQSYQITPCNVSLEDAFSCIVKKHRLKRTN